MVSPPKSWFEKGVLALAVVTVASLLCIDCFPRKELRIAPDTVDPARVHVECDSMWGGASRAKLTYNDSQWRMDFELRDSADFPTAILIVRLDSNGEGLDLSVYDEIQIWIESDVGEGNMVRVLARNADVRYTRSDDPMSLKINEIMIPCCSGDSPLTFDWGYFHVPGWWLAGGRVPYKFGKVEVGNVHTLEFTTPELMRSYQGYIAVKAVVLQGAWISHRTYYEIIFWLWLCIAVVSVSVRIAKMRRELKAKDVLAKELQIVNRSLSDKNLAYRNLALNDALTGLLNRHGLRERLFVDLAQKRKPMGLVLIDIDHFKAVNDLRGHDGGDEVLRNVAQAMRLCVREGDLVCRWGGEEFLVIVLGGTLESSAALAERIRLQVGSLPDQVTCSAGVAMCREPVDFQQALSQADKALYQAKGSGRNRVVVL